MSQQDYFPPILSVELPTFFPPPLVEPNFHLPHPDILIDNMRMVPPIFYLALEEIELEQTLGAFWEHMPPIDPVIIRNHMLRLRNEIRILSNRKKALLEEQQSLAALRGDRRN